MIEWEPHVQVGGTIPASLWQHLRGFGIQAGVGRENAIRIVADNPEHYFIQGLASCGVTGAHQLDAALTKFGAIFIFRGE